MGVILKNVSTTHLKKFNYAIMLHGDNQYNPKYISNMLKLISKTNYDAIVGSRMKKRERIKRKYAILQVHWKYGVI